MEAWMEKNILEPEFPFRLFINEGTLPVPHHWHDEIEIIYMIDGGVKVGINDKTFYLNEKDILIIGSGDIHCFLPEYRKSNRLVIQFSLAIFDNTVSPINERKEIRPIFDRTKRQSSEWSFEVKLQVEKQIQELFREYERKEEGYKLALKARLYDLVVLLIRKVPIEARSIEEENKKKEVLGRLENVFQYVENNFAEDISLEDGAREAGFSIYHFTRFFKQNTGITFGQYLSHFRITRAEWLLMSSGDNITEIALKCGFNSIKTFNKVFRDLKSCSPSQYRKKQNMRIS
jgi:AraC-like DNA-binding protein